MSTMSVLVTGGAGYVGSHTAVMLLEAGYDVVIVDNLSNSNIDVIARIEHITKGSVTFYHKDLCDADALNAIFANHHFHAVLHFAGHKSVAESVTHPLAYYHNNVTGSIHLLTCIEQYAVPHLIFSSSATVYGANACPPYTEDMPLGEPTSPYGATKQTIEKLISAQCLRKTDTTLSLPKLCAVSLRYFNPIGAHPSGELGELASEQPNNLLPIVLNVAVERQAELAIYGEHYPTPDGTCRRDYVHVMDVAAGHVKALAYLQRKTERKNPIDTNKNDSEQEYGAEHVVFNLGTGTPLSVLEIVRQAEQIINKSIPFKFYPARVGDLSEFWADTHKALNSLDWRAEYDITQMIKHAWSWHTSQYLTSHS